jgi:hypothetical protein
MRDLKTIIIAALALVIVWQTQCNRVECPDIEPVEIQYKDTIIYVPEIVYEIDSIPYEVIEYREPKYREAIVQYIAKDIDTAAVIHDYYKKRTYIDTISIDTLGTIIIEDVVYNNEITSRKVFKDINYMSHITLDDSDTSPNKFYWGIGLEATLKQFNGMTSNLLWLNQSAGYGIGIGVDRDAKIYGSFQMYWRLGGKR